MSLGVSSAPSGRAKTIWAFMGGIFAISDGFLLFWVGQALFCGRIYVILMNICYFHLCQGKYERPVKEGVMASRPCENGLDAASIGHARACWQGRGKV